ncbi:MAG: CapA family protein [Lachnospiraceae bacterium]|nr:CapA family protein [Lachnospiraceae bacterium]
MIVFRIVRFKNMIRKVSIPLILMAFMTGCAGSSVSDKTADSTYNSETRDDNVDDIGAEENDASQDEVTIIMAGDILLHDPVNAAAKREDGTYDYSAVFANTAEYISAADIAIVNQEVIIGGEELGVSGYPNFNAPEDVQTALCDAGFDVVLHATNHALDRGKQGILNCLDSWEENHPEIEVIGINESSEEQDEIPLVESNGITFAILNYTYGTNGIALPDDMPYAVNLMDEAHKEEIKEDLIKADELADFVIVCPHWGTEYVLEQTTEQEQWASFFAENGADLIIGTHPHVIEPIEMVGDTLCYYSLGNFVNWTSGEGEGVANRMVGALAEITVTRDEAGEAVIKEYSYEPVVTHVTEGTDGVTVYFLSDYNEELSLSNEIRKQDSNFDYDYCVNLCDRVFEE